MVCGSRGSLWLWRRLRIALDQGLAIVPSSMSGVSDGVVLEAVQGPTRADDGLASASVWGDRWAGLGRECRPSRAVLTV